MPTARLQWTLSPDDGQGANDVVGYEVARNNAPNATTVIADSTEVLAGVSQYDDEITVTGTYYWRVRAVDNASPTPLKSPWSNEVSQQIDLDAPGAPSGLNVTVLA